MLVLVGLNHKSAPLSERERMGFSDADLPDALGRLTRLEPVKEGMILSTCNRVEILARAADFRGGISAVKGFLARDRGVTPEEVERYTYQYEGRDAVRHLFRVASGLDSMVLGEPQILGQVKRAYAAARGAGTTGAVLEHLLQQGLSAAKRVRSETGISRHAVSVAFAAVELARRIFGELGTRSALLLGAGKMTELAAENLVAGGVSRVVVTNRTYSRAVELAERFGGVAVNWDERFSQLEKVDIVVTGTAAPQPILDKTTVQKAIRARRSRPLFLIDIAVPRDVEPSVNEIDNVYLYDIDDLQGVVDANLEERQREAEIAERMIEGEVDAFDRWRQSLEVAPTIVALRETLHGLARRELERFRRKLGPLTPDQEHAVEELTRSLIQKVLHPPIQHLKRCAERGEAGECASRFREIFAIPETKEEGTAGGTDSPDEGAGPRGVIQGERER